MPTNKPTQASGTVDALVRKYALLNIVDWIDSDLSSGAEMSDEIRREMIKITRNIRKRAYKLGLPNKEVSIER